MTNAAYQKMRLREGPSLLVTLNNAVTDEAEEGVTMDEAICHALTDLRHLCDVHGFDFGAIDRRAYAGYVEETSAEWRTLDPPKGVVT